MLKNPFRKLEKTIRREVNLDYTVKTGFVLVDDEDSSIYNLPKILEQSLGSMSFHEKKEIRHLDVLHAALRELCSHKNRKTMNCIILENEIVIKMKAFDFMDSSLIQVSVYFPSGLDHAENGLLDHLADRYEGGRSVYHLRKRLQILNSCRMTYYFAVIQVENLEENGALKDEHIHLLTQSRIQSKMRSSDLGVHLGNGRFALILAAEGIDENLAEVQDRFQEVMNFEQTIAKVGYKTGIIHSASVPSDSRLFDVFYKRAQSEMERSDCRLAFC
ncbi:MAG: hypothetical protein HUJ54_13220 [Erysipelotrichaceae bacterium]|nr:hypothetical protein [Erysipelotrichaceae bacterium]